MTKRLLQSISNVNFVTDRLHFQYSGKLFTLGIKECVPPIRRNVEEEKNKLLQRKTYLKFVTYPV